MNLVISRQTIVVNKTVPDLKTESIKLFQFRLFQFGRATLAAMLFQFAALLAMTGQTVEAQVSGFNQTGAGPYDYANTANWVGGTINGLWDSSLTLAANQTVTFGANYSTAGSLIFSNAGNYAITLESTNSTTRLLTMNGSIIVGTNSTTANVTIGDSVNHLNVRQFGNYFTFVAAGRKLTLQDVVSGTSGQPITKTWPGTLALLGLNTFTDPLTVLEGTVSVNTIKDFGTACSVGQQSSGSDIKLSDANFVGTLEYVGTGDTANRTFRIGDTTAADANGGIILNDGSGALTLSATTLNSTIASITTTRTITLGGSYTGSANTISGIIQDNNGTTGKTALTKAADNSSWTLAGANTYSGASTVSGGTLKIDAGAGGSLNSASTLTMSGGTLVYDNTTSGSPKSQTMGNVTAAAGGGTVQLNRTASQSVSLTLGTFTRQAGGTVNFVYGGTPGTIGTDSAIKLTASAGFLNSGAFVDGSDVAYMDALNTFIRHPVYGTDANFNAAAATLTASVHNLFNTSTTINSQANVAPSSIKVTGGSSVTVNMATSQAIQCNTILVTGGSSFSVFGGSIIKANGGSDLVVRTDTINDTATFGYINDNSTSRLNKTGAGRLSTSGGGYTGATYVNAGSFFNNAGTLVSPTVTVMNGATFGGVGTISGTVTANSGAILSPGASGLNSIGTFTLNNAGTSLTLNGNSLIFDLPASGTTCDKIAVTGALAINGANTISLSFPNGPAQAGTYVLMTTGSRTGTGTIGLATNYQNCSLAWNGNNLELTIAAGGSGNAPSITTQPTAQSTCAGSTASFSVTAANTPLSYAWSKAGTGWGNSWSMSGGGGVFRGNSTGNENGGGTCNSLSSALDINSSSGNALGIYGGSSPEIATRTFTALTAGQVVSLNVDNGGVDSGKKVGFSLQTSGGSDVLQFYFLGGQSNYKYNDGTERDTGIGFIRTGLKVQFVLNSSSTYTLIVQSCGGTVNYFSGTYAGGAIAKLKLFNENTSTGAANDAFFNNFIIGGYVDNADNYSGSGSWASLDNGAKPIATGNGSSSYTTPATVSGDNGSQYQVVVYNSGGTLLSSAATLTVNSQSTITTQPASQTRAVGNNVTFSVTATGGSPAATYQWQKNGANISGANSTSYTINNVQTTDAANASGYSCVVSNGTCFQSSSAATLTVNVAPTVSGGGQPVNATTCSGNGVSFTNTPAAGAATASYQWRQRSAGWDSAGWVLTGAVVNQAGAFVGSATNNNATTSPTDSNLDGDINTAGRAWAMFANSSQTMNAERVSSNSLAISQTVQMDLDNGAVQSGASAGFSLKAGTNVRFEFIADGTSQTYKLTDNAGVAAVATGVPLTKEGVRVTFTLTAANTYSVSFTTLVDGVVRGPFTGTLASSGSLDRIRVYNFNSGANSGSDLFFNNLTFGSNSDNAADTAYNGGLTAGSNGGGLNLSTGGIISITSDSTKSVLTVNPATASASYDVVVSAGGAPSVTSSAAALTVNPTPTASNMTYSETRGLTFTLSVSDLLTHASGSGGVILTAVQSPSANGVTVMINAGQIYYFTAVTNTDTFTYTVTANTGGCTATGTVTINPVYPPGPGQIGVPNNGVVNIKFFGIPGTNYVVETATNVTFTPFWPLSTNQAGSDGSWQFTDLNATNSQQYYRSTWKP